MVLLVSNLCFCFFLLYVFFSSCRTGECGQNSAVAKNGFSSSFPSSSSSSWSAWWPWLYPLLCRSFTTTGARPELWARRGASDPCAESWIPLQLLPSSSIFIASTAAEPVLQNTRLNLHTELLVRTKTASKWEAMLAFTEINTETLLLQIKRWQAPFSQHIILSVQTLQSTTHSQSGESTHAATPLW